jgi:hypothetical protein
MEKPTEEVFVELIRGFMSLSGDQVVVRDQNFKIPPDNRIYVIVGMVDSRPYSGQFFMESRYTEGSDPDIYEVEVTRTQVRENIQIDIMSRSNQAILRKNEVYLALNSILAKQSQEVYGFKISRIPTNFVNTSSAEGGSNLNRFTMVVPALVWYQNERIISDISGQYYDQFTTRVDDEETIGTETPLFEFEITPDTPDPAELP